jgi:hypothetical protein
MAKMEAVVINAFSKNKVEPSEVRAIWDPDQARKLREARARAYLMAQKAALEKRKRK